MEYKLTIDQNLMHEDCKPMGVLKRWKNEGKIDLRDASRPQGYIDVSDSSNGKVKRRSGRGHPGGENFKAIASIVFPQKDPTKLELWEYNEVVHLSKHHERKNEFFVTRNTKIFVEDGKRERLKEVFGILIVSPEEVVELITKMQGWNI